MSQIKLFALGGLGEDGKNMYVVEVDQKIFVLDAGIKYPTVELYGIDAIIPDFSYLVENKKRIQGLFLSHGHEDHIGALPHLLKEINVPIYASDFTMELIQDSLKEEGIPIETYKFFRVNQDANLSFGNVKVNFFSTTHSIPESLGIVIKTKDGNIIYTSDFTFDQNVDEHYRTSFKKINEVGQNTLCALVESVGATYTGNATSAIELYHKLNSIFTTAPGRIIFSLFSSDLLKIQKVVDLAIQYNKRIAVIGRRAQRIVDLAINLGYLKVPEASLATLRYIDDKNKNDDKDLVALVTGSRHEPFFMLQRMVKKADRLIHINDQDSVVLMTSPIPGTEKMAARTLDVLHRTDASIHLIHKNILTPSHASSEEIKMFINMITPQYIVPVIGEYRHQYALLKAVKPLGYDESKTFLLDNGDVLEFNDGIPKKGKSSVKSGDVLIDGAIAGDVNEVVIRDRELLSEDGVLLIVANVNPRTKKVLNEPEIVTRGFVYVKESEEVLQGVKDIFNKVSEKHLKSKYINWSDYKNDLRNDVNRYLYKETKRSPITIPVIISTEA